MLVPRVFADTNGRPDFHPGPDYRYAMGMGASLMAGWTVLLLWANRRPVERRDVLLITIVPVVLGLGLNEIVGTVEGFTRVPYVAPIWAIQLFLVGMFVSTWWKARDVAAGEER
jgi:hypothetical protein